MFALLASQPSTILMQPLGLVLFAILQTVWFASQQTSAKLAAQPAP